MSHIARITDNTSESHTQEDWSEFFSVRGDGDKNVQTYIGSGHLVENREKNKPRDAAGVDEFFKLSNVFYHHGKGDQNYLCPVFSTANPALTVSWLREQFHWLGMTHSRPWVQQAHASRSYYTFTRDTG